MANVVFRNITVVDPQSDHHLQQADVWIKSGIIHAIAKASQLTISTDIQEVNIEGACLSPGWLDMHVHLSDPGYEWKENLNALSKAAITGGFTDILCYPNTVPVVDHSQMIHSLLGRAIDEAVSLHFCGTLTQAAAGKELAELYDMHSAGAIAFTDGTHHLQHTGLILRALQYMQVFEGLMIHYPSDNRLVGNGQMNEGIASTRLGMPGIPELAEASATAKDLQILAYAGGRMHLQPMSAPTSLSMIKAAKQQNPGLSVGTDIAYLCMDDEQLETFDSNYKLFPPLRSVSQQAQLQQALQSGLIDSIASGHWAQTAEEKQMEFSQAEAGILGLQTAFSLVNMHLIEKNVIDLSRFVELIAINPRKILKIPALRIAEGEKASLTCFHPSVEWTFNHKHIFSRSRNSPCMNQLLKGKVLGIYHKELLHLATD